MSELGAIAAPPVPARVRWRILLPFAIVTLIWGSTWIVIRGQLGIVPANWSVAYRFLCATAATLVWALVARAPLRLGWRDLLFAAALGLMQFCLNFNFVYRAEGFVTSGVVAVVFALLVASNAILAWVFLRQGISRGFLAGSAVAFGGIGLLFAHEMGYAAHGNAHDVARGIGYTLAGVLCASTANVMQITRRARALAMPSLLFWAMLFGAIIDAALAWGLDGPPVIEPRATYLLGVAYLGLFASALAFPLYFGVIRAIGPARAAYSGVLTPVLAMALSTLFEGYVWTPTAAAGGVLALAGLVVALRTR